MTRRKATTDKLPCGKCFGKDLKIELVDDGEHIRAFWLECNECGHIDILDVSKEAG